MSFSVPSPFPTCRLWEAGRRECRSSRSYTMFFDSPLILVSAFLEMPSLPPPLRSLRLSAPPHAGSRGGERGREAQQPKPRPAVSALPSPRPHRDLPSSCPPRKHPTQAWRGWPWPWWPLERREGRINRVSSTATLRLPPPPIPLTNLATCLRVGRRGGEGGGPRGCLGPRAAWQMRGARREAPPADYSSTHMPHPSVTPKPPSSLSFLRLSCSLH